MDSVDQMIDPVIEVSIQRDPSTSSAEQLEQEPRLAYGKFGSDVPGILATQAACRLCVSEKLLALGTEDGAVHLLDYDGNRIKTFREHRGAVTDLSFDGSAESLASCSSDGTIAIYGLYSGSMQRHTYSTAITTVALDPRFSNRKTQEFIYGTAAGALVLSSKGWLGQSETVLFQGRGAVHTARMSGTLLAWVTDTGVWVYDTATHGRVGKLDRPSGAGGVTGVKCCALEWVGKKELLIGWGRQVMAVELVQRRQQNEAIDGYAPPPSSNNIAASSAATATLSNAAMPSTPPASFSNNSAANGSNGVPLATWELEIASSFEIEGEGQVAGVAPFGRQLAVLTWQASAAQNMEQSSLQGSSHDGGETNIAAPSSSPAFLKIYDRMGYELFSDPVELQNLNATAVENSVECPVHLSAYFGPGSTTHKANRPEAETPAPSRPLPHGQQQPHKWWADGEEPLYYILGGNNIAIGRPRTSVDRISWLAERLRFLEAVAVAEGDPLGVNTSTRSALGEQFLQHLFSQQAYMEAARLCPRLLLKDASAWERWVYAFGQVAKLPLLVEHLPVVDPTLSSSVYDLALAACLRTVKDHAVLLRLVNSWPPSIYDVSALLKLVSARTGASASASPDLRRTAAALHSHLGEHEAALRLILDLRLPEAFDYVRDHALASVAAPLAAQFLSLDEVRATSLFVDCWEQAAPSQVVASLQQAVDSTLEDSEDRKIASRRLYHYLDWLWQREAAAATPFAALHVELCAVYDPDRLLRLLTSSTAYPLDAALEVCERAGLIRESVFVLGRMGAADAALRLIVDRLRDVAGAVAFVREQHDEELWELLISLTLGDAALAGELLDHAGGAVDPLRVVSALPQGMAIERLRDRLVRVIGDFRGVMSLQQGCNAVLTTDCLDLNEELYGILRRALRKLRTRRPGGKWGVYDVVAGEDLNGEEEESTAVELAMLDDNENMIDTKVWVGIRPATTVPRHRMATPPVSVHSSPSKYPQRKSPLVHKQKQRVGS